MSLLDHHADKWQPEPNTGCYLWTAWLAGGQGMHARLNVKGRTVSVARVVCEEAHGPPPSPKHEAAHNTPNGCVGGLCVNGNHLRWATKSENQLDVLADVRAARAEVRAKTRRGAKYAAIEAGLTSYISPCKYGHLEPRLTTSNGCPACNRERMRLIRKNTADQRQ